MDYYRCDKWNRTKKATSCYENAGDMPTLSQTESECLFIMIDCAFSLDFCRHYIVHENNKKKTYQISSSQSQTQTGRIKSMYTKIANNLSENRIIPFAQMRCDAMQMTNRFFVCLVSTETIKRAMADLQK